MEKTDVLVIGGSAAGIVAAVTGKSNYPDRNTSVTNSTTDGVSTHKSR